MLKIGIDMDGTVVDFTTESFKRVEELYGIKMTLEDAVKPKTAQLVWERMTPEQRAKYPDHRALYGEICGPGFFLNLPAFDGAIEAVKKLARAGNEIIWITKVLNWDRSAPEKDLWLANNFGDIEYHKIMVDSVVAKRYVSVDVIVDDDPAVLAGIDSAVPIMIKQPWNQHVRGKYPFEVDTMTEAAEIIMQMHEHMDWWDKKGMK